MFKITEKNALNWYEKVIKDFPQARFQCQNVEIKPIVMSDGTRLNTRIFRPNKSEPYDVLFTRNPYPANETLYEALYIPFVEQGYCVVIQDCRGTGNSEGNWEPFKNERNDGIQSLKWLNRQNWISQIATFGRSYSAYTQWIVGDELPEKVKTMFLEVYGVNRYDQVYTNGVFREDIYTSWAFANSGVSSNLTTAQQYKMAINQTPAANRDINILQQRLPFYQDYLKEVDSKSEYWKKSVWQQLYDVPEKINVPVVVTDGWADHHLQGSLLGFRKLKPQIKRKSRLIITPTDHIGNLTGDLVYKNADKFGFMNLRANLDWFNHILCGKAECFESSEFLMRGNKWIAIDTKDKSVCYQLSESGKLKKGKTKKNKINFFYDPTQPLTFPGGNELLAWISPNFTKLSHGFVKTKEYEKRPDLIRFETNKFTKRSQLTGKIKIHLSVSSNKEDTAFSARVCEHTTNGEYINIKDGISSLRWRNGHKQFYKPNKMVSLDLELGDVAWEIQKNSSIVLLISSSNFPMYAVHSNEVGLWSTKKVQANVAKQTIYVGQGASYLELQIGQ